MINLLALYGHWCTADGVREALLHQGKARRNPDLRMKLGEDLYQVAMFHSARMRIQVFYALEYVVIDGYRELGDHAPLIDGLLKHEYVNDLRRIRNAVFHYQVRPLDFKLRAFLEQPESETWITTLHAAFGSYFREQPLIGQLLSLVDSVSEEREGFSTSAEAVMPKERPGHFPDHEVYAGPERRLGPRRRLRSG